MSDSHNTSTQDSDPRATFPGDRRLHRPAEYQRVYDLRTSVSDGRLRMFAASNGSNRTRIGLSVSRKHGNSVVRHRLKRLLREAYRLQQHALPEGWDLILIPQIGVLASVAEYQESVSALCRRIAPKIKPVPGSHRE